MEQKNKAENGKKEIYQTKLFWIASRYNKNETIKILVILERNFVG